MDTIPAVMRAADRWLRWTLVDRGGLKPAKVPLTAQGRPAKVNDPETWSPFRAVAESRAGKGMGFVLGKGIGCIDLDEAILPSGAIADWAEILLDVAPKTFVEVSQSGRGLHVFGLLAEAPGRNYRSKDLSVEVYSQARYIATTGDLWGDSPLELADLTPFARALEAC